MKRLHASFSLLLLMIPVCGVSQQPQMTSGATQGASNSEKATNATPQAAVQVNSSTYVIGAEDALQVTVWKEPTLSGTFPVRPDGMISLVLVGDVPAAGQTPLQLGNSIAERLKKFIQDPSVSVVVTGVNSQRIFVIGEVNKVGPLQLTAGMTPLQAIATAGGLTNFANPKHIYILRGEQGKQQKIPFNYKQALKGDNKQLIALRPGDTIVVP
jgi:polysaccharide export outer membrane protein